MVVYIPIRPNPRVRRTVLVLLLLSCLCHSSVFATIMRDKDVLPLKQRHLRLRIRSFKDDYRKFETIPLSCWLENIGPNTEYFRYSEIAAFDGVFDVRDLEGVPASSCGLPQGIPLEESIVFADGSHGHDWISLVPNGTSQRFLINVLDRYGVGANLYCFFLPPGEYRITADGLASDTVMISVLEPGSQQEQQEEMLFEQAITAHRVLSQTGRGSWMPDFEERYRLSRLFIDKYPSSVLSARLLHGLLSASRYVHAAQVTSDTVHSYALALLVRFPLSGLAATALAHISPSLLSTEERRTVIDRLALIEKTYPNTRNVSEPAESLLARLRK